MPTKSWLVEMRLRAKGLTEFQRNMKLAGTFTNKAAREMERLRNRMRMIGMAAGIAGITAVGLAIRKLVSDLVQIPSAAQDAQRGLAIIMQSTFGVRKYDEARNAARGIYNELMRISDVSPGNITDYMEAFRDVASMAQGTGASVKELIDLTQSLVTLEKIYGFQTGVVSRDVRQMLGGMGNIALIQTPQFKQMSLEAAKMAREGDKAGAVRMITRAATMDPTAITEFGMAWSSQLDTMQNNWIRFTMLVGEPVLQWLTDELRSANGWLKSNKEMIRQFARTLSTKIIAALKWVKEAVMTISKNWHKIVMAAKIWATLWVWSGVISGIRAAVAMFQSMLISIHAIRDASRGIGDGFKGWASSLMGIVQAVGAIVIGLVMIAAEQRRFQRSVSGGVGGALIDAAARTDVDFGGGGYKLRQQAKVLEFKKMWAERSRLETGISTDPLTLWRDFNLTPAQLKRMDPKLWGMASRSVRDQYRASRSEYEREKASQIDLSKLFATGTGTTQVITQNNDLRGSRIAVEQNFRDEDPDAVFFAFNQGIGAGVVRTVSDRAPHR